MYATAERTLSDPLLTDQYTLAMAQSFWRHGQADEIVSFEMFVRRLPEQRSYLVAAGLEQAVEYLMEFGFSRDDVEFLSSQGIYDAEFLDYLRGLWFDGDVHAVEEGTVLGAEAPLLSVTAPRAVASIIEPALLTIVNHQTMIASKASRIVRAASGSPVWDFSLRRLHGLGAAMGVARASYIGGCAGTATVAAGRDLGLPTTGTMAHHYVQSFGPDREQQAFEQFLLDYPDNGVLLVDTYETTRGVERAIAAGHATGVQPKALRLDSGDLGADSRTARALLDQAGYKQTKVLASNDLDEYKIEELVRSGAPIEAFGVGTMLGTSADAPNLGGVYKLVGQDVDDERPTLVMKLAENKNTDPGLHQLWRLCPGRDVLALRDEDPPQGDATPLLGQVLCKGHLTTELPGLDEIRERCTDQLSALPQEILDLHDDGAMGIERSYALSHLRAQLRSEGAAALA